MRFLIVNGPNLNLLGKRETSIYGDEGFDGFFIRLQDSFSDVDLEYYQSNVEGELVNKLQSAQVDGVLLNAAAYTHTSVALRDAVAAIETPVVEVHISNVLSREEFRHTSLIGGVCVGSISGFGLNSYRLGVTALVDYLNT
jgi:3-dehydroquinate dehydratase-2